MNTCIQSLPSIFIARFLRCFEDPTINVSLAVKNLSVLLLVLFTKMTTENSYFYYTVINALEVRGIISGLLFDKSLLLPSTSSDASPSTLKEKKKKRSLDTSGTGSTLNLLQIDTSIIENFFIQIHTFWDGPLQVSPFIHIYYISSYRFH